MAEQLRISSRAYSDLERGKYAASAPTLLFLFSMLEADAQRVLIQQFMKQVKHWRGQMLHERHNGYCRSI